MIDLSKYIEAKSDQLNADDLIGKSLTIEVTGVKAVAEEQPVLIAYAGDNGKPYKPCKSMRRVLVRCWGADGLKYVGRKMTLYRDDAVVFGGQQVGGIRISHLSHIDAPITLSLTASKKSKKPFTVQPLIEQQGDRIKVYVEGVLAKIEHAKNESEIDSIVAMERNALEKLKTASLPDYERIISWADVMKQEKTKIKKESQQP